MSNIDVIKKGGNSDRVCSACSAIGISFFCFCPHQVGRGVDSGAPEG